MRAVLVTAFPEKFVQKAVLPHLRRRVEILEVVETSKAENIDFAAMGPGDIVLHMIEFGGHTDSEQLSRLCRQNGIPIKPLSRKKASWSFLPPPSDEAAAANEPDEIPPPSEELPSIASLELVAIGRDLKAAREQAGLKQHELADVLGITQSTVSSYETGKTRPTEDYVRRLLRECALPVGWRGLGATKETLIMNTAPSLPPASDHPTDEVRNLRSRVANLEHALGEAKASRDSALKASVEVTGRLAEAEARLKENNRAVAVQDAVRTLYEAGLLTADEVVAKLCPKR